MKEYKKLLMEILELKEDIVRTSGGSSVGGGGGGDGDSTLDDNDPRNEYDDLFPDFGNN